MVYFSVVEVILLLKMIVEVVIHKVFLKIAIHMHGHMRYIFICISIVTACGIV